MEILPFYSPGPQGEYIVGSQSMLPCVTPCPLITQSLKSPKTVKIPALKRKKDDQVESKKRDQ